MKVLHSYKVYRPDLDGGIPFVIATLSQLIRDGVENNILVARLHGLSKRYVFDGVPVEAVTSLGTFFSTPLAPSFPFTLLRRALSYDLVVHHAPFPLADIALSHLPQNVALIVYWHAEIARYKLLKRLVSPAIFRTLQRADRIVVADRATIENSDFLPRFAEKCSIVPFGTDVDFWSICTKEEAAAAQMLRTKSPRMVLAIGRFVSYKGFDVLLKAMKTVDGQAVLIGDGPLLGELRQKAFDIGIADRVIFTGRTTPNEIKTFMHAARVLAFPSTTRAEAFGIVQLEAMAAGLPIVNTALRTAVPNIARHGKEALTVPPNDPLALAAAIQSIIDEPASASRLGQAGQLRARTEYSLSAYASRMAKIYDDVVSMKRPSA